jgi:hypothetical protein
MIDHRYLTDLSRALHLYLGLAFIVCATLSIARAVGAGQMAGTAKAPPRSQPDRPASSRR